MSFSADRQTVRLLDQNNNTLSTLVGPMLGNQSFWMFYQFDLRNFRGRAMRLAIETYNDSVGSVTWMFTDTVSMVVCNMQCHSAGRASATFTPTGVRYGY